MIGIPSLEMKLDILGIPKR